MALCVSQLSAAIFTPFFVAWGGGKPSSAFLPAALLAATAAFFGLWMDEGKAATAFVSSMPPLEGGSNSSDRSSAQREDLVGAPAAAIPASVDAQADIYCASEDAAAAASEGVEAQNAHRNMGRHAYSRLSVDDHDNDESHNLSRQSAASALASSDQGDLEGGYVAPSAVDVLA